MVNMVIPKILKAKEQEHEVLENTYIVKLQWLINGLFAMAD